LDVMMPELGGLQATQDIRRLLPQTEVLVYSMLEDEQTVREAVAAGANGYVAKSEGSEHIPAALDALARHQPYFSPVAASAVLVPANASIRSARPQSPPRKRLTERQREVARLVAQGMTTQEIADTLVISVRTAKTHRANIMRRLEATSVAEIVLYAVR